MLLSSNVLRQSIVDNMELSTAPFDLQSSLVNPFVGFKTEYQQTKFFKENFGLIVSGKNKIIVLLLRLSRNQ